MIPYYCSLAIIITFIKYFYLISCIFFQYVNERFCGEYRSRTDDLLRARQAL